MNVDDPVGKSVTPFDRTIGSRSQSGHIGQASGESPAASTASNTSVSNLSPKPASRPSYQSMSASNSASASVCHLTQ